MINVMIEANKLHDFTDVSFLIKKVTSPATNGKKINKCGIVI